MKKSPLALFIVNMAVPIFMVVSGYTFSLSAKDKSIKEQYNISGLMRKAIRFTVPTIIAVLVYCVLYVFGIGGGFSQYGLLKKLLLFDYGPGAYYYPLLIQLLIIFPIMYSLIMKYRFHGVIAIGLVSLICELVCSYHGVSVKIYRLLLFRYFLFVAAGIYLKLYGSDIDNKISVIMLSIGILYMLLPWRFGYEYRIFTYPVWKKTSMVTALYVVPIIYMVFKHFGTARLPGFLGSTASLIGQASYHIMYTQLLLYDIKSLVFAQLGISNEYIGALLYIVVSIVSGIGFYKLDGKLFSGLYIKNRQTKMPAG